MALCSACREKRLCAWRAPRCDGHCRLGASSMMLWVPPPAHTRGTRPTHTCTDGERGGAPTPPWGARLPTGRVCPPHQLPPPRSEAPRQTRGRPTPGATRARPALSAGAVGGLRPPAATPLPAPVGARQRWIRNRRGEPSLRPTARWDTGSVRNHGECDKSRGPLTAAIPMCSSEISWTWD